MYYKKLVLLSSSYTYWYLFALTYLTTKPIPLHIIFRKMVSITGRASSCLALALSILLSSLANLFISLSCVFFSSSSGSHPTSISYHFINAQCFSWSSVSDDLFFCSCSFWFSFLLFLVRVLSSAFLSSVL